jgi:tight adherence protein B
VTATARDAYVRIFSVALRGRQYRPRPLQEMAAAAGGTHTEAKSAADLAGLFDELGSRLANEYLLQYRSSVRPNTKVKVSITVDGIEAIAVEDYVAPALAADAGAPFHRSFAERFWKSGAGMLATILFAAAFVALAVMAALRPRSRTLRKRMAEFVSLAVADEAADETRDIVASRTEKTLERTAWWTRFTQDLELAEIRTPAVHIVLATAAGTVLAVFLLLTLTGSLVFAPLGLAVPFIVRSLIRRKVDRKRRLFADQLPDNLQVLASALRAGHSLVGALSVVVDDCPEPSRSEFGRIVADEQLGVPLEDAFGAVSQRMDNRDLEQVALVAALQRETGGNTAEVLDRVAETIRSRFELRRLVKTLTTQGRMSRWVVSLLPVGLLVLITAINPEYMEPLYVHPLGRVLLLVAGVMVVAGSLVIKRIINIKV